MTQSPIGALELTILLAVARAGDDAFGLTIRRDVSERLRRDYSVGAVYTTLERLEAKGLVTSRRTEPTPTRGGRSRRQFKVSAAGRRAIRQAEAVTRSVWDGLGSMNPKPA